MAYISRRSFIGGLSLSVVTTSLQRHAQASESKLPELAADGPAPKPEHILGNIKAPSVESFLSWTCSHCAVFHTTQFPILKRKLIETNNICYFNTPIIRSQLDLSLSEIARSLSKNLYEQFCKIIFETQSEWITAHGYPAVKGFPQAVSNVNIPSILEKNKFPIDSINISEPNKSVEKALLEQTMRAIHLGLSSTPGFLTEGKILTGQIDANNIIAFIQSAITEKTRSPS